MQSLLQRPPRTCRHAFQPATGKQQSATWRSVRPAAQQHPQHAQQQQTAPVDAAAPLAAPLPRRQALLAALAAAAATLSLASPRPAAAFYMPPPGYRQHVDRLDGYTFVYPEEWSPVTSSGNDIFLRNPFNVDENLFVDISSPSSSRYNSVEDLGTPQAAAAALLDRYLNKEFMSTRLGISRSGEVLGASQREADGRLYYDIQIRMTSFASRNPYVSTPAERMGSYGVEWDRVLCTTLGVANKRLYELRAQTRMDTWDSSKQGIFNITDSFRVKEVEV